MKKKRIALMLLSILVYLGCYGLSQCIKTNYEMRFVSHIRRYGNEYRMMLENGSVGYEDEIETLLENDGIRVLSVEYKPYESGYFICTWKGWFLGGRRGFLVKSRDAGADIDHDSSTSGIADGEDWFVVSRIFYGV